VNHVFVSYSRRDAGRVEPLVAELRALGVDVWIDTSDIPVSAPWAREIQRAIRASSTVLVVWSPEWEGSEVCGKERDWAVEARKPIVMLPVTELADPVRVAATLKVNADHNRDAQALWTRLQVRADEWHDRGEPGSLLAVRGRLKELKPVLKVPQAGTLEARFVRASRRRHRRNVLLASLGAFVIFGGAQVLFRANDIAEQAEAQLDEATQGLAESQRGYDLADWNIYAGLERAAENLDLDAESYTQAADLMSVLSTPVPDHAGTTDGRAVAALVPGAGSMGVLSDQGELGTDSERGAPLVPGTVLDSPVQAAATGIDGVVLLATTTEARTSAGEVHPGCGGTVAARGPDGSWAVADGNRVCWSPVAGRQPEVLPVAGVRALAFSSTGLMAVTVAGELAVFPFDGRPASTIAGVAAAATLVGAVDGSYVAVGRASSGVLDIRGPDGELLRHVVLDGAPTMMAADPLGRFLAVGVGRQVEVVDVRAGRVQQGLVGLFEDVRHLAWSRDGTGVWAGTAEQRVVRWTFRHSVPVHDDPRAWVTRMVPLGPEQFVLLDRSGRLTVLGADGVVVRTLETGVVPAAALAATPDGASVALVAGDDVLLVNLATGAQRRMPVEGCDAEATAFSPAADRVHVACSNDSLVSLDVVTGSVVARTDTPEGSLPYELAVSDDGALFVGGFHGAILRADADLTSVETLWDSPSCNTPRYAIAVAPDGSAVVAVGDGGEFLGCVVVVRLVDGRWTGYGPPSVGADSRQARAVAVSPDGRYAALGWSDGRVSLLDLALGNPGWIWDELPGQVRGLSFTDDGAGILAATRDGVVATLPGCVMCGSTEELVRTARDRVAQAQAWGLIR
jgi:WD40 repeat protein